MKQALLQHTNNDEIYTPKNTDTLSIVADKFNTTEEELRNINGLDNNYLITPDKELIVPKITNNNYDYYTVKKGDNIYQIAQNNNMDYELLLKMNGLDKDDYIYPNQTILLPKKNYLTYLTKEGDTIKDIISKTNTDLEQLLRIGNKIYLAKEQIIIFEEK